MASDQYFYDLAAEELSSNRMHQGLWLRAFSDTNGDPMKAHALYVKYRVESLKEEYVLQQKQMALQLEAQKKEQSRIAAAARSAQSPGELPLGDKIIGWVLALLLVFGIPLVILAVINYRAVH
jgi:hypothetical protein